MMSFVYPATTTHSGLSKILVNCVVDKLVISNNVILSLATIPGESIIPQFSIYWSNVSKFSVDRLIRGGIYVPGSPNTRIYHIEFIDFAALPVPFQMLLEPSRKFSFSITDHGPSLLFDAFKIGCLKNLNQNGDYLWEIHDNPSDENTGGPRAIGWGRETGRLQLSLEEYIESSILIWRGSIPFTEIIIEALIDLEFELRSNGNSFDYLDSDLRLKIQKFEITKRMIRYFRERYLAHFSPDENLENGLLESTNRNIKDELIQNPVIPFDYVWYTNDREVGAPCYGEVNTELDQQPEPARQ